MTRSALVARPPALLYRLVEEVEHYPEFVPGCSFAQVLERGENQMLARLVVRRGLLRADFTTRNVLDPDRSVHMQLVKGPFRVLEGRWSFMPVASNGCRIEFALRFQFSNALKSALFEPLFEEAAGSISARLCGPRAESAGLTRRAGNQAPKPPLSHVEAMQCCLRYTGWNPAV